MEGESSKRHRHTKSSARCRRSPSPLPRSPSRPPRSPSPPPLSPPNPTHGGVVCRGPIQAAKLEAFLQRVHSTQQFAYVPSLCELQIYNQVHTLFRNIGWQGLLRVHKLSYKVPTNEFLSSLDLDHGVLCFRLMNHDHSLSLDQINAIVGAPTEHTLGPNDPIPGYSDLTWSTDLTRQLPYVSSTAKASSLIHPMMKVAHRIIASLVVPREERSTISTLELKILYVMAHSDDNLLPHYGSFHCNKLTRLSTSRSGKISCGGLVSLFSKSAPIRAPYPRTHQPIPGETYLTTGVLESMRMFRAEDRNHNWTRHNNFIDWKITPYLFTESFSKDEEEEGEESDGATPKNSPPMGGASSSHHVGKPSYHEEYMDQFQSIHTRLNTLNQDLASLTQSFSSFTTQYTRDQERQCKHEEDFWAWTRNSGYYPYPRPPPQ
ncbi:unnamed protein product [Lactuca saligna]|uniref:Arabidopsis retrotransposon Orf1 C-terminal domain-containing protein n=1 Tax=Lactuca saligna TaxID=75948 RepID=A0AA35Y3J2_LACSI|nr:unnamed protein product [Lactuca saligna]